MAITASFDMNESPYIYVIASALCEAISHKQGIASSGFGTPEEHGLLDPPRNDIL
ncbi:MAG: hypothetical protein Fur0043_25240 [Anaerolineales bacterium]